MAIDTVGRLFAPNLPITIKKARARAVEHPQLFLKGKVTALVQVLITYTDLDKLGSPILFKRTRPATVLGVSTRTIDRLLKELEGLGWLIRLPQPRLGEGVWGCTSIEWAKWVIKDIFTLSSAQDKWGKSARCAPQSDPSSDPASNSVNRATETAHLSSSPYGEVFQNKVVDDASSETTFDPYGERKPTGRRIPADLVDPMKDLDLTPSNICWLMAQCKRKGIQLQQVFKATYDKIKQKGLKARKAVSWLMYMINLDRDYAHEARQADDRVRAAARKDKRDQMLKAIADAAFVPGAALPEGRVVLQRLGGIVSMSRGQGHAPEASPDLRLAQTLAEAYPGWARSLLRGKAATPVDKPTSLRPAASMPALSKENRTETPSDKATSIAHLAAIKAMLKPKA